MMATRFKLAFINIVIALGVGAIIWVQWPEAMKSHSIGAGYEQGAGASIYLALLLTGIPALIYAVFVYVTLTHWLFRPDELKAHRARRQMIITLCKLHRRGVILMKRHPQNSKSIVRYRNYNRRRRPGGLHRDCGGR